MATAYTQQTELVSTFKPSYAVYHSMFNNNATKIDTKNTYIDIFYKQYDILQPFFGKMDKHQVVKKFETSLQKLQSFKLDNLSFELTNEYSIFYILKIGGFHFYLQYYINDIEEDDIEAVCTVFENDTKQNGFAGSFVEVLDFINSKIKDEQYNLPNLIQFYI